MIRLCYGPRVSSFAKASHPLPEPLVELIAQRFRVLGEPMRIRLLDCLRESDASVTELQAALGASQQNVSKHLGILHAAGMLNRTKHGNTVRYSISDPGVFELCDQVCGTVSRQLRDLEAILSAGDPRPQRRNAARSSRRREKSNPRADRPATTPR